MRTPFTDKLSDQALVEIEKMVAAGKDTGLKMDIVRRWIAGKKDIKRRVRWGTVPNFVLRKIVFLKEQKEELRQKIERLDRGIQYLETAVPEMIEHAQKMKNSCEFVIEPAAQ